MDLKNVQAIIDWQEPSNVKKLRLFFRFDSYYRKFIDGYSKMQVTLTDLLQKDSEWVWSIICQEAFQNMKEVIAYKRIPKLPNYEL